MDNSQSKQQRNKALAVIAGDIHYSLPTLEVADTATRMAIAKANELGVPFIANGDTHETKANLRGECVNALIETFKMAKMKPYLNIGNHCKISAKSIEHSLNFLAPYATVVDRPDYFPGIYSYIVPYYDNIDELRTYLKTIPAGSRVILHQGLNGSNMGHYIKDESALDPEDLKDFRSILSHYHARQDIKCGRPRQNAVGLASFVGNPYTLNFGEANDPPKGFQILMSDGTLEFVPTNLRKHVVIEFTPESKGNTIIGKWNPGDLVWIKAKGSREWLNSINKKDFGDNDFKLTLEPTDLNITTPTKSLAQGELLDSLIDSIDTNPETKSRLKTTWKSLCAF